MKKELVSKSFGEKMKFFILFLFFATLGFAQENFESKIDIAYQNAKKGIYHGFENLNEKKNNFKNDLIIDDKLISTVSISKEINGVKIESTGFYESFKISITAYKSFVSLINEGFYSPDSLKSPPPKKKKK